jgi:SagB-type dehydrogenase family enzyme
VAVAVAAAGNVAIIAGNLLVPGDGSAEAQARHSAHASKWREYHELTKHTAERLRRTQHVLDWKNMPDPFRHYEGVPIIDLPADPPPPELPVLDGPTFLSQLLFHSAAVSASKVVPSTGYRYALRVNPSSGNLHPTEFHFLTRNLTDWPDGLYHYRPSSHMAEQRAIGTLTPNPLGAAGPLTFVLSSIVRREAWKYRDRAYRYCLHDIGHAWQALALAAGAAGCGSFAIGDFPDDEVAHFCRLHPDEWPMLVVTIDAPHGEPGVAAPVWFEGRANQLSPDPIRYDSIEAIHAATKIRIPKAGQETGLPARMPAPHFGSIARRRRSALDFRGGSGSMSQTQLAAILTAATQPLSADFAGTRFIDLYLYVHRVDGLAPGVYRYGPQHAELEPLRLGDQRVAAAGLSLGQDLAGNACVAFSMIADLDRATRLHGDRGYRYAHFEAGAIGQRLYIAAESLGLGATGIGAFFDDEVNRYLNLASEQVVYHFAIGHPVPDSRVVAQ